MFSRPVALPDRLPDPTAALHAVEAELTDGLAALESADAALHTALVDAGGNDAAPAVISARKILDKANSALDYLARKRSAAVERAANAERERKDADTLKRNVAVDKNLSELDAIARSLDARAKALAGDLSKMIDAAAAIYQLTPNKPPGRTIHETALGAENILGALRVRLADISPYLAFTLPHGRPPANYAGPRDAKSAAERIRLAVEGART